MKKKKNKIKEDDRERKKIKRQETVLTEEQKETNRVKEREVCKCVYHENIDMVLEALQNKARAERLSEDIKCRFNMERNCL